MARTETAPPLTSRLVQVAAAIVIIFSLRYAKEVLIPIALAILFSFLLAPLVHRLERFNLKRAVAVLIVVLLSFAIIGSIGVIVAGQLRDLADKAPQYADSLEKQLKHFQERGGMLSKLSQTADRISHDIAPTPASQPATQSAAAHPAVNEPPVSSQVTKVEIVPATAPGLDLALSTFGPVLELLATAFIVIVLCIFMLIDRENLRDRVIRLVSNGDLNITTQAMDEAATRVSKYLVMQAITNGTYGVCVAIGLLILRVPNALLWGLLASLLRFLPYIGPWLGASVPLLLAFVTHGAIRGIETAAMYATLEVLVSSFIEPWLYGSHTGVSAVAILVAAAFWAWIWGTVGLLLATPLTVVLVVLGKYVPQMEFLNVLLGDEPVFDPPTRYYQRLLASDQEEASDLVEEYRKTMSPEVVYETVLIPALSLAHRDRFRGRLDPDQAQFVRQSMREEIEEMADLPATAPTTRPSSEPKKTDSPAEVEVVQRSKILGAENVQILCLPARDEADELAGMMFAQVLELNGFKAEAVSVTALASEMLELVAKKKADIVVISALPPSAVAHARYLCKRLRQKFPDVHLVIGLWTLNADTTKLKARISCGPSDPVITTFSNAIHEIEQLAHPLLLAKLDEKSVG